MTIPSSFHLDKDHPGEKRTSFLVIETQGELYAIRWALVSEVRILLESEINFSLVPPEVRRDGFSFPLFQLWQLVELKPPTETLAEIPAVFLEEEEKRMVLIPDRILWRHKAEIQELPTWLKKAPAVKAAIVLGSGVAVIVLEPFEFQVASEGTQ